MKKVFLEISQNLQENTCARVLCFPVNFVKFLRTTLFTEHLWWLLLEKNIKLLYFVCGRFNIANIVSIHLLVDQNNVFQC